MSQRASELNGLSRHELNTGFHWERAPGPFRRISEEQALAYAEQGFFVLEDAFDPATVAEVIAEIDPLEAKNEASLRAREDGRLSIERAGEITFTNQLSGRSPRLREFCSGEIFRDLAHDLLGPNVHLYVDQSVYKKPGTEQNFPWHQDNGYQYIEPQHYLTCWVALTDTDEANGCPWVLPGAHRFGTLAHRWTELGWICAEQPTGAVSVPVRAGSIAVFPSLMPHATGPNRSTAIRKAYIVQFAPSGAAILRCEKSGEWVRTPIASLARTFPILVDGYAAQEERASG